MLKKKILLYLLLTILGIGETVDEYLKIAITSSEKGYFEISNKYLQKYIESGDEKFLDYAYLLYGYNLLKLEDYSSAIEKFEIIIKRFPLSPYLKSSYIYLITSYLKTGNSHSAFRYYKDYIKKFDKDKEMERQIGIAIFEEGISDYKIKKFLDAKEKFNLIINEIEDNELNLWANYYLGLIEFQMNNFKNAEEYFKKVIPEAKGEIFLDSELKIGDCYFNMGDYENAENFYREVIKNDGSIFSQWAKFQIAMIEKRKGNMKKSEEILNTIDYSKDIDLKFNVLNEKSNIYIFNENWDEAEKVLNQIINEFSDKRDLSEILFKTGIVNFNKKDYKKAIDFFEKAKESEEKSIKEKSIFFIGYINYLNGNFEEALKFWEIIENQYEESSFLPRILFLKGRYFYEKNKFKECEDVFKKIIEKETPYYEESYSYLVDVLIKEKKFEEAELLLKNFLEKKREPKFEFLLGKIFYLKGNKEKAKEIFENLKIENPVIKAEMSYYLGEIYKKEGNLEKAKEKFIEVISLYPQFKEWKELSENSLKELKN